jgi:predicted RNA-binding protein YlqC (UPF0109 family)
VNSMSLAAEREILKQIHKLNIAKQKMADSLQRDQQVKEKRAFVTTLKDSLKEKQVEISEIKKKLSTVHTAVALGCEVEDLVVKRIDCPHEKIGKILGKKGKNIQELMSSNNVDIKIDKILGEIRLTGMLESLETAMAKINQTIAQAEDRIELSFMMHKYLTGSKILATAQLRSQHSNVSFNVYKRKDVATLVDSSAYGVVRVFGLPDDVKSFKAELLSWECVSTSLPLSSRDKGLLVGKGGLNVANLVQVHQAIIDIHRTEKSNHSRSDSDLSKGVTIFGPSANVEAAKSAIKAMIEFNQEFEELVPLDSIIKSVFLLNNGAKVQALQNSVNETLSGTFPTDAVIMYFRSTNLVVKGKVGPLQYSINLVHKEVQRIRSLVVKIKIDPFTIPLIIGKSGQGIKSLKGGATSVFLEVDRAQSVIEIVGLDKAEVDLVVEAVKNLVNDHQVKRLQIDFDDTKTTKTFPMQYQRLVRSPIFKEIRDLVFVLADNEAKEIVVRGKKENLKKSAKLVKEFFELNFVDELSVEDEGIFALQEGGNNSKIKEIAKFYGVSLICDKKQALIVAKGNIDQVFSSIKSVQEFLFGSDDFSVLTIKALNNDVLGVVIGKSGKKKAELEAKYSHVTIHVHRNDAEITVRGIPEQAEECQKDIVNILAYAKTY